MRARPSQAGKNPALLKLELALRGVSSDSVPAGEWIELQLDPEVWARGRVNPASSLQLAGGRDATVLREGDAEYPVRMLPEPDYAGRLSRAGTKLGEIAAVHGTYAVVQLGGGCGISTPGRVCALCRGRELTEKPGEMWPVADVVEALRAIFDDGAAEFTHFQLGFLPGDDGGLKQLFPYVEAVHRHFDTMLAVTMHPPGDPRSIELAYAAGIDALSYNLEAADADSLRMHFPGRARFLGRDRYLHSLAHAAKVFPSGAVLCELVLGLSPMEKISAAIRELTELGVMPVLSIDPAGTQNLSSADLIGVIAQLFEDVLDRGLNMTWARDLSNAITPLEARYFVENAPQMPVLLNTLARNRIGALATRSLARLRRRLRVKWVRTSLEASRL